MAVTVTLSAQLAPDYRKLTIEDHGKLRFFYAKATQGAATGDATSSFTLGLLPPGRVRILPFLSRYKVSAMPAAVVMAIGHDAYFASSNVNSVAEPQNLSAFAAAIAVNAAVEAFFPVTAGMKYDMYSRDGIMLRASFTGATPAISIGGTCEVLVAYIYE